MRSLVYYVGASLDGYIAAPDGSPDAFPMEPDVLEYIATEHPDTVPTHMRERAGIHGPPRHFDTVIMGRRTYEPALAAGITSPYSHLQQIVVSTTMKTTDSTVRVVSDPSAVVDELKAGSGRDIWLAGGGRLAGSVLAHVDRIVIKTYPVVFGDGIPIVSGTYAPMSLTLAEVRHFDSGAVVTTYERRQPDAPDRDAVP
ncbi:MAG: dihydrofolate reductase family protein [Acidimicrobiia bacterium]|nr:dihydrofolate reductase family protein [Acidimicrobiia bacterium]